MSREIYGPPRREPPVPPLYNSVGAPRLPARQGLPRVEIVEPFDDSHWNTPGTYGRRIEIEYPREAGTGVGVFENTKFNGPPRPVSIQLFRSDRNVSGAVLNADYRARLVYGCSGINNEMLLDWGQGVQFPLVCNSLRIDAVSYAPDDAAYTRGTGQTVLGAIVGQTGGVGGARLEPTFTSQRQEVAAVSTMRVRVPDLARRVYPQIRLVGGMTYADISLIMFQGLGAFAAYSLDQFLSTFNEGFVIPGGCDTVALANVNAAEVFEGSLCFGLGL